MIMFFDTETTGFVVESGTLDQQPHVVQLAATLCEPSGKEVGSFSFILQLPEGVVSNPGAVAIHGITTHVEQTYGVNRKTALNAFWNLFLLTENVAAHNFKFDKRLIDALMWRERKTIIDWKPALCTMELSSPILALPPTPAMMRSGRHGNKSPKLSEAYEFFFNEPLVGAHDALVDVRACARIYFHMKNEGMIG